MFKITSTVLAVSVAVASLLMLSIEPASANASCYNTVFAQGSNGECVSHIQERLVIYRCLTGATNGTFGSQTTQAVKNFQTVNGLTANGTVGIQTIRALDAGNSKYCSTPTAQTLSAPTVAATTSTHSKPGCTFTALSARETGRLLGKAYATCEDVIAFQRAKGLKVDGIVGPATATRLITQSANPCGIYGGSSTCFLGLQSRGNLGTLYTVVNGVIVATMPARFGNADHTSGKGKQTPEGSYAIFRSIAGDHAGDNCPIIGGERQTCMRNPLYFHGGKAIHGTAAPQSLNGSLGCIGVSNDNSDMTYQYFQDGVRRVVVVDFQRGG